MEHTVRQTGFQTDRHSDRQTDRHIGITDNLLRYLYIEKPKAT